VALPLKRLLSIILKRKWLGQVKFHHLKLLPLTLFSNHFSTSNPKGKKTKTQKVKKLQSSSSETNKSVPPKYIAISHAGEISIIDKLGVEQQRAEVPYGALISIEEGQWVQAGQIIAHWDPHTYPLISQVSGYVRFVDLIEGITIEHQLDEFTGQKILIVADPRLHPIQTQIWRPMIKIVEQKNKDITLDSSSAAYWLPPHAIIHVADGAKVNAGDLIAQLPYPPPQNPDIVGQFPRILELFEARSPKKPAILAQRDGTVTFLYKGYKNKYYLKITDSNGDKEEYSFPLGQLVRVFDGQTVNRGDVIVEGQPDPHELLRLKGVHAVVHYMLKEIQTIYRSQGIKINDKHLEVILCQMLHTATIIDPGDTSFSAGMQVNYKQLHQEHQLLNKMEENSKKEIKLATWQPQLRSITQVSLETSSFISAASFRDTIRALLTSSIKGQRDELRGPKENIILGRLIPAGTGFKQDK
jgi:DNA-directed RNA polymerase subunit beta'